MEARRRLGPPTGAAVASTSIVATERIMARFTGGSPSIHPARRGQSWEARHGPRSPRRPGPASRRSPRPPSCAQDHRPRWADKAPDDKSPTAHTSRRSQTRPGRSRAGGAGPWARPLPPRGRRGSLGSASAAARAARVPGLDLCRREPHKMAPWTRPCRTSPDGPVGGLSQKQSLDPPANVADPCPDGMIDAPDDPGGRATGDLAPRTPGYGHPRGHLTKCCLTSRVPSRPSAALPEVEQPIGRRSQPSAVLPGAPQPTECRTRRARRSHPRER